MPGVRAKNKMQIALYLDKTLKGQASKLAESRDSNLTQLICDLLEQELAAEEKARIARAKGRKGKGSKA